MVFIILLITLAPFRFQLPADGRLHFSWSAPWFDLAANAVLFLPVGFLFQLAWRKQPLHALWFGLLLSTSIEALQIFLPGRFTTATDILMNSTGSFAGALLFLRMSRTLEKNITGILTFELPLMSIIYLLTPLLWLNSLAAWKEGSRLVLLLIPGLVAVIIVSVIYTRRFAQRKRSMLLPDAMIIFLWFLLGVFPALFRFPRPILLLAALVAVAFLVYVARSRNTPVRSDQRFEIPTLRRILPFYILYLLLSSAWPFHFNGNNLTVVIGLTSFGDDPSLPDIFRLVEYLAAISLLGYIFTGYFSRQKIYSSRAALATLFAVIPLELIHSLLSGHPLSLSRAGLAMFSGIAGILMYVLQLQTIRLILFESDAHSLK
jgi:hypothetical protein